MAEGLNGYFSSVFTREEMGSLPVPDAKFHEAKSEYLGLLFVIQEMVAKKIKATKDSFLMAEGLNGYFSSVFTREEMGWMSSKITNGNSRTN